MALAAKKAGEKDKAIRYLTEIKAKESQIVKLNSYTTLLMKNSSNLAAADIDSEMGSFFEKSVRSSE